MGHTKCDAIKFNVKIFLDVEIIAESHDVLMDEYYNGSVIAWMRHIAEQGDFTVEVTDVEELEKVEIFVKDPLQLKCWLPGCKWEGTSKDAQFCDHLNEWLCPGCGLGDVRIV